MCHGPPVTVKADVPDSFAPTLKSFVNRALKSQLGRQFFRSCVSTMALYLLLFISARSISLSGSGISTYETRDLAPPKMRQRAV